MPLRIAAKMREPAEHAYFREQVEPLLGDGVEYVGEVGLTDKVELLRDAVCLLNPIDWDEPFGMVMVEVDGLRHAGRRDSARIHAGADRRGRDRVRPRHVR